MPERENYLSDADVRYQKNINKRVRGGGGSQKPPARRRRGWQGGSSGNVIRATVNQPGTGVLSGDPTGPFDNAVAIVGSAPSGGTGTFQNVYGEAFADNAPILLFQRKDTGNWETEKSGGSSYTPVVLFELTEDKAYADTAKLAKPLDATGVVDAGADAFYVLDAVGNRYGKAPTGGDRGYQGTAILATDDHSGGVPGYRIIEMEQPAHFLTGILSGSYSGGGTPFTPSTTQIWGRAERGRRLPATGDITVMDDDGVASAAQSGDKWLIAWNEAAANYTFVCPLEPASVEYIRIRGVNTATVTTGNITIDNIEVVQGADPRTVPGDMAEDLVVTNVGSSPWASGAQIDAFYDKAEGLWKVYHYTCVITAKRTAAPTITEADTSASMAIDVAGGIVYGETPPNLAANVTVNNVIAPMVLAQNDVVYISYNAGIGGSINDKWDFCYLGNLEKLFRGRGGWVAGQKQSLGHDASGNITNQTDGVCS